MATKKKTLKPVAQPATIIIPEQSIIVGTRSVRWDHPARNAILANIKAKNWAKVIELMNPLKAVLSYGKGQLSVRVEDNEVIYKGDTIDGALGKRLMEMMQNSMPIDYLLKFVDKARLNPSFQAQKELYGFIEYGGLPITADGNFLGRKVVRSDFRDKHTGTVDYTPGRTVSMPRHKVDDDSRNTCSSGLHLYSAGYSKHFASHGDKFLLVEVDPTDVCAVPSDYQNTKMRTCRMKVVKELTDENDPEFFGSLVYGNQVEVWS